MASEIEETIGKNHSKESYKLYQKLNDKIKKDRGKFNQQNVNNPMRTRNLNTFETSPPRLSLNTHNTFSVLQQTEENEEEETDSDESENPNDASKSEQDKSFAEIVKKHRPKKKKKNNRNRNNYSTRQTPPINNPGEKNQQQLQDYTLPSLGATNNSLPNENLAANSQHQYSLSQNNQSQSQTSENKTTSNKEESFQDLLANFLTLPRWMQIVSLISNVISSNSPISEKISKVFQELFQMWSVYINHHNE